MLILPRRKNESIVIGDDVVVTVIDVRGDKVRLGVVLPRDMPVRRQEDGMTQREWEDCNDPAAMLRLLRDRGLVTDRKARLFAAACCRWHWAVLGDEARQAVEAAERHADGLASREELDAARCAFTATFRGATGPTTSAGVAVSYLLAEAGPDPVGHALDISPWAARAGVDWAAQAGVIRCLFGPSPFTPLVIRSEWLAWGDRVVPRLAESINDEGAFDRMPILADALEEAGMDDQDVLGHLRGLQPHCRGCHVLDEVLGKR
jgi:carbon storage regulator CsrA